MIALLWTGLLEDPGTLLLIEHVVMLPAMLLVMLMRPDEYSGHGRQDANLGLSSASTGR